MRHSDTSHGPDQEWQAAIRWAGQSGLLWAVIKLLLRKGVFTVDELRQQVITEVKALLGEGE